MLTEASHWLQTHPMQRAMQATLAQLDELILELRAKVQERPSTDELRSIAWSELNLNTDSKKPAEPEGVRPGKQDAFMDEDADTDQAGVV